MIYLILCVLSSSAIFIIFKLFEKFKIHLLQAIVINYFTAFLIGTLTFEDSIPFLSLYLKPWFIGALILAFLTLGSGGVSVILPNSST